MATSWPDSLDARIVVNPRQGLSFLFFGPEYQNVRILVILASAGDYGSRIELGKVVDVYIESIALFKSDLPLKRYSSVRNKESKACFNRDR